MDLSMLDPSHFVAAVELSEHTAALPADDAAVLAEAPSDNDGDDDEEPQSRLTIFRRICSRDLDA